MASNSEFILKALPYAKELKASPSQDIVDPGEKGGKAYYLEKGTVEVSNRIEDVEFLVAIIGEGEFFGETGFFDEGTRVRNIRAIEESIIRIFDHEAARKMLKDNPELHSMFLFTLAKRICSKFRRMIEESRPLDSYAASLTSGTAKKYNDISQVPIELYSTELWREAFNKTEEFKTLMYDLTNRIQFMPPEVIPEEALMDCHMIITTANQWLQEFTDHFQDSNYFKYVIGYIFKEMFPYFMRSNFAQRAYFKPRGYAGDFLMMEAIYRNQPMGEGNLGIAIDYSCLQNPAPAAVRGRRQVLRRLLNEFGTKILKEKGRLRILNLACGSNRELFDFISDLPDTRGVEAICIDADQEALTYTSREVDTFDHDASIRLLQDNVVKWSLGRRRHQIGTFDIIYSSGLTDYLDKRLFIALLNKAHEHLNPDGYFIVGNFSPANPNKAWMDHILQWRLIHRSPEDMDSLFRQSAFQELWRLDSEELGVNLFAIGRKKKEEPVG